jgi:hypothetical protein
MKTRLLVLVTSLLFSVVPSIYAADVIQTQPATEGDMEVDVTKASVKDGILTVLLAYRNKGTEEARAYFDASTVYYIDEKEKKKYHLLKDNKGVYVASPLTSSGNINVIVKPGGKVISWFKFPAPPAAGVKINLVIPNVVPFEDLPITP